MIEGERKLASIRRIASVDPIPGADQIVKITVDGWELVTQKANNFQPNDLVLYFEVDSFLPVRPEFEFLRQRCFKSTKNLGDGFRLKTIKLRGQVSQGLALPLKDFFKHDDTIGYYVDDEQTGTALTITDGTDVTELLGVQKYEKPIPAQLAGQVRGNFPSFLRKTDQERIQNCFGGVKNWITGEWITDFIDVLPEGVQEMEGRATDDQGRHYVRGGEGWIRKTFAAYPEDIVAEREVFEATLKLDGSSMTIYYNEGQVGVCSRNLDLKRDMENLFWKTAVNSGMVGMLAHMGLNIAVQGELMGPGVQGNREKLDHWCFYIFDIFDIDNQRYLTPDERKKITVVLVGNPLEWDSYRVDHAPVIDAYAKPFANGSTVQDILAASDNTASINVPTAEGIVYKSRVANGPTFKAISNKYLLAEKD